MLLGENGETIKRISSNARGNIEKSLGVKIHLFLFVKVRNDWEKRQIESL